MKVNNSKHRSALTMLLCKGLIRSYAIVLILVLTAGASNAAPSLTPEFGYLAPGITGGSYGGKRSGDGFMIANYYLAYNFLTPEGEIDLGMILSTLQYDSDFEVFGGKWSGSITFPTANYADSSAIKLVNMMFVPAQLHWNLGDVDIQARYAFHTDKGEPAGIAKKYWGHMLTGVLTHTLNEQWSYTLALGYEKRGDLDDGQDRTPGDIGLFEFAITRQFSSFYVSMNGYHNRQFSDEKGSDAFQGERFYLSGLGGEVGLPISNTNWFLNLRGFYEFEGRNAPEDGYRAFLGVVYRFN